MLQNYLVTALRNFTRHKLYSIINVAGLAVALACTIFIILFIRDELSYDRWIPDSANIYRVESSFYYPGRGVENYPDVPFPVSPAMQASIPEVEAQTHLIPERMAVNVGDQMFLETLDVVDPNFFRVIKLPFAEGDPASALAQPESIVLSQTAALKFFGTNDPIGRTLTLYGTHIVTVTGVLRDLPHNTHMIVDIVLPNTSKADGLSPEAKRSWLSLLGQSYVKLVPMPIQAPCLRKSGRFSIKTSTQKKNSVSICPEAKPFSCI